MKNALILTFFFFLITINASAQSPWYFGSGKAVNLTNAIEYKNCVQNISGSLDPSSVAVNACAGSMYLSTSGTIYVKQDAGSSTNWLPLGIATPGSLTSINGQSGPSVTLASGASGTDFVISAAANTLTFNIPSSSASNRGLLTSANWTTFNNKEPAITATTSADYYRGDKTFQPLNKAAVGLSNVDNTSDATKNSTSVSLTNKIIDADLNTITNIENADIKTGAAIDAEKIANGSVTSTEFQYIGGLTSDAQAQIDSKITGPASLTSDVSGVLPLANGGSNKNLTASDGAIAYSDTDSLELLAPGTTGQILQSNGAAAPSFVNKSISGKAENASSVTVEELQVPNNLLTNTATGKYLVETGNKSILANGGFEAALVVGVIPSWNFGTPAPTQEISSTVIESKALAVVNTSTQQLQLFQDSTLYASAFASGVNGSVSAWINNTAPNVYLCQRQAGSLVATSNGTSITNCLMVRTDGIWSEYVLPVILGATSNGIAIVSLDPATAALTNTTGTTYIDDAKVQAGDLRKSGASCNSIECETEFSGNISSTGVVSDENYDFLSGNCTTAATTNTCSFNAAIFSSAPNCTIGKQSVGEQAISSVSASGFTITYYNSAGSGGAKTGTYIHCQRSGTDFTNAKRLGNNTTYSSQNADTDWASCGHTTSDFTGFGTVSAIETQCKRQGSDLLMRGKFTSGTSTAVEARLNLKLNGATLTSADTAKIPSIQALGAAYHDESTTSLVSKFGLEPSISYVTFLHKSPSTTTAYTKINGNAFVTSGKKVSLELRIPIAGWENSNQIIGSFKEVMTVPGVSKPVNFSFFYGSAGATFCTTSPCTVDQIGNIVTSMTRGSAGNYTINLDRTYSKVQCTYNGLSSGATSMGVSPTLLKCSNCSSLSIATQIPPAGAIADTLGSLVCVGSAP